MAPPPAGLIVRRLSLIIVSTVLAISGAWLIAEITYRLVSPPSYVHDPTLVPDVLLGWDSVPTVRPLPLNERGGPVVVYLGDSFTQGAEWPSETQRLAGLAGLTTTGFNLGVSGFGTTQEMLKLRQHLDALKPQAVILLLFAWNDLRDNYPYPEIYYGPQRTSRPYLVRSNGQWSLTPVRWASSIDSALQHSEAYLRLFNRATLSLNARVVARWPGLPAQFGWPSRLYYEQAVSWQPFYRPADAQSPFVQGAYDTTIEAMRQIREMTTRAKASLLVIGIDNSFTVDLDDLEDFITPHPELDPSLPMRRMAAALEREDITFVNAQPELAALRQSLGHDVYNGPRGGLAGHLGPEGDRAIARIAARWLSTGLPR